jgi:primosomal protein N' (replication factor Y)
MVAPTEAGRAALSDGTRLGRRQRDALAALVREGPLPSGEIPATELEAGAAVTRETLKRLEARGLVALRARERRRRPSVAAVGAPSHQPRLAPQQQRALAEIVAAIEGGAPRELLLHGVTGSGKTEVYIAAAEAALQRGRGSIVLVPEIALTPQIVTRFASRFGDRVALLHSRLPRGERRDEWQRLESGEARICVGPRSAVFAPVGDLGLVVIDEEHDASYKQEGDPRYDARCRVQSGRKRRRARGRQRHASAGDLAGAATAGAARSRGRQAAPAG